MKKQVETKPLTMKEARSRKILIFIGRGKSILSHFIAGPIFMEPGNASDWIDIKERTEEGPVTIHLTGEDSYKKLPLSIKRRALKFYINF